MRAYLIENGVVLQKAAPGKAADDMGAGWIDGPDDVVCGYTYDGTDFAAPVPDPAEVLDAERAGMVVSRFQAKAALMQAGKLQAVEDAVAAGDALTQLAWAEAVELKRNSPMIAALAGAIGLTDAEVDDLFRVAAQIEA